MHVAPSSNANLSTSHRALFHRLKEDLRAQGFFAPTDWFWTRKLALWVPLFFGSYAAAVALPFGPLQVLAVLVAGMGILQFGFVGHDAGHLALSDRRWRNDFWGQIGISVICGLSFQHWRFRHNVHHARCQEATRDPDMQFNLLLSVYPDSAAWQTRLGNFFLRIQKWSFWPFTPWYWATLRYDAIRALFVYPQRTNVDRFFVPLHFLLLLAVPIWLFGWKAALCAYILSSCIGSVLSAAVFVPNHIGMRIVGEGEQLSFLFQQVETSRNVQNPPALDFLFGGLNYQIEHHLFPRVQHDRLRGMGPTVRAFCQKHGISYHQEGMFSALGAVHRHLGAMTEAWRERSGEAEAEADACDEVGTADAAQSI